MFLFLCSDSGSLLSYDEFGSFLGGFDFVYSGVYFGFWFGFPCDFWYVFVDGLCNDMSSIVCEVESISF